MTTLFLPTLFVFISADCLVVFVTTRSANKPEGSDGNRRGLRPSQAPPLWSSPVDSVYYKSISREFCSPGATRSFQPSRKAHLDSVSVLLDKLLEFWRHFLYERGALHASHHALFKI